jgi:hypothetical protein
MRHLIDDELRRVLAVDPYNATALEEMRSRFCDGMRTDTAYMAELEQEIDAIALKAEERCDELDGVIETLNDQVSALEQAFKLFCS